MGVKTPNYSSEGAPTGHTSAQLPQEMHSSALISNLPSPSEMQEVGQPSAHAPQEMHSSLILKAIVNSSVKTFGVDFSPMPILYHIFAKNQEPFAKKFKNTYQSVGISASRGSSM